MSQPRDLAGLAEALAERAARLSAAHVALARYVVRRDVAMRVRFYRALASQMAAGRRLPVALAAIWDVESDSGRGPGRALPVLAQVWLMRLLQEGAEPGEIAVTWLPRREAAQLAALASHRMTAPGLEGIADGALRLHAATRQLMGAVVPMYLVIAGIIGFGWYMAIDQIPRMTRGGVLSLSGWAAHLVVYADLMTWAGPVLLVVLALLPPAVVVVAPRWGGPGRSRCDDWPLLHHYARWTAADWLAAVVGHLRAGQSEREAMEASLAHASPYTHARIVAILRHDDLRMGEAMLAAGTNWPPADVVRIVRHATDNPAVGYERSLAIAADEVRDAMLTAVIRAGQSLGYVSQALLVAMTLFLMLAMNDIAAAF